MSKPDQQETVVMFRISKSKADRHDVFALFPDQPGTTDNPAATCGCYQHVGQHSTANFALCIMHSRPAKPEQYADLMRELEGIGYKLKVIQRAARHSLHRRAAPATS